MAAPETIYLSIKDIKPNPNNPRLIKDNKFEKLVHSIKEFPQMLELRPIVLNKDMIILGGNMRFKACKEAGMKEIPVQIAENLTPEQEKEFIIKDNTSGGEWDWNMIASEWDSEQLEDWGLDLPGFDAEDEPEEKKEDKDLSDDLKDTFEVIVECGNEEEQEAAFDYLIKKGYICRVLTL
ncbi:MAG: ParB N-terminal domain-containing protein [Mesonia sp.]|uniref:ParB N-terminal domain-containing protein n=1 Tax=Mesonia sp. TaxID=1960830 RepID=UPI003F99059B